MTDRSASALGKGEADSAQAAFAPPRDGAHPEPLERLMAELQRLPGIGRRSAERLAFHVLRGAADDARALADAIVDVKRVVRHCDICWHITQRSPCPICADPRRDRSTVMVVEQPRDLLALEQTGMHRGVYHVLMGRISPLDGVGPGDITLEALLARVDDPARNSGGEAVKEVILALNPNLEGDGTALHITEQLRGKEVRVTRLARGLAAGSSLEHANKAVLADAIAGRRSMESDSGAERAARGGAD